MSSKILMDTKGHPLKMGIKIHILHRGQPICGDPDAKLISECPTETTCLECRRMSDGLDRAKHKEECGLCRGIK